MCKGTKETGGAIRVRVFARALKTVLAERKVLPALAIRHLYAPVTALLFDSILSTSCTIKHL